MRNRRVQSAPSHSPVPAQLADYRWLVDGLGRCWLERPELSDESLPELARRLRRDLSPVQTHLVLQQIELRRRAARRWPSGAPRFLTERTFEQATDPQIAAYKASRLPPGQGIVDLGCGIGGDLCALARRGPVLGVERDPIVAYLARANLRQLATTSSWVAVGDADQLSIVPMHAIHLDPDRRPAGRRSVQLAWHQPGAERIAQLVPHPAGMALKLAPATDATDPLLVPAELEWIGHDRQCQQLVAWFGPLARDPGCRVATVIDRDGNAERLVATTCESLAVTTEVRRYLFEPHPALLAAGLASVVAARHQADGLTAGGGYLTADRPATGVWATSFEVLEVMPFRQPKLRGWLAERGIGRVEVKKRSVAIDPGRLQRQLRSHGTESATVILVPLGRRVTAIVARRLNAESSTATVRASEEAMITGSHLDPLA